MTRPTSASILGPAGQGLLRSVYVLAALLTASALYLGAVSLIEWQRGANVQGYVYQWALIVHLARLAVERGYGRLEWSVLDWNAPAIGFYTHLGADVLPNWRLCRVSGASLTRLAAV